MKLTRENIRRMSVADSKAFVKSADESKLSAAAQSIINKKKLNPDSAANIKNLL